MRFSLIIDAKDLREAVVRSKADLSGANILFPV